MTKDQSFLFCSTDQPSLLDLHRLNHMRTKGMPFIQLNYMQGCTNHLFMTGTHACFKFKLFLIALASNKLNYYAN